MESWDAEDHPWEIGEQSPLAQWARTAGYDDQWELIAAHVANGDNIETAPRPSMRKYETRIHRPTLEGIRQARLDAADLIQEELFDPLSIMQEFANRRKDQEARDAEVEPGEFQRPVDWSTARIHTTVTRLFTDPLVHSVDGSRFHPFLCASTLVPFHGRLHLGGHADIDTGIELDGHYKVDLFDAGSEGPGSGDPVLRVMWGSEDVVVGAILCGWLEGWSVGGGFGPSGASREIRDIAGELPDPQQLAVLTTNSGTSAWCLASAADGFFDVFLVVDKDRNPVGAILDSSKITQFAWYDPVEDEPYSSDWPIDAREFDAETDTEGVNPNVTTTAPPAEEKVWSVEHLLADDSAVPTHSEEPLDFRSFKSSHLAEPLDHDGMRIETQYLLTTARGEHIMSIADDELHAIEKTKSSYPDDHIVNIKVHSRRWVWDR